MDGEKRPFRVLMDVDVVVFDEPNSGEVLRSYDNVSVKMYNNWCKVDTDPYNGTDTINTEKWIPNSRVKEINE